MATSQKKLNDKLREKYLEIVKNLLEKSDEEVLIVGSNEIAIPCLDEEDNDKFIVVTVKVPTGSRDGETYDGYEMAEDWVLKCKTKAEKEKKKAEEKEKKIKRDEKAREKKKLEKGE